MAEESPAFVARNAALATAHQEAREGYAAQSAEAGKDAQQTAAKTDQDAASDS
ncbi:MAG: hypothetical protein ACN6PK_01465 [Pseudomonas shirazensis]